MSSRVCTVTQYLFYTMFEWRIANPDPIRHAVHGVIRGVSFNPAEVSQC